MLNMFAINVDVICSFRVGYGHGDLGLGSMGVDSRDCE